MVIKTIALLFIWMCLLLLISISAVEAGVLRHLLDQFLLSSLSRALVNGLQVLVVIGALFGTFFLTYYLVPVSYTHLDVYKRQIRWGHFVSRIA